MAKFCVIIPAYNPGQELIPLVEQLLLHDEISGIIIVNDGSASSCAPIFFAVKSLSSKIAMLEHAVNLGKGAALKTGLNYVYTNFRDDVGVVTADADGQHLVEDILRVGQQLIDNPQALIMGVREFAARGKVPLRSKIGNLLTIKLFKLIVGQHVSDTQSGLRGIPFDFIPILARIPNAGYDFELNMLIVCKQTQRKICEIPIKTVYIDNNKSSHFNPVFDSLKIYFVLFRFALLSLATYALDLSIFIILLHNGFGLFTCQLLSRTAGVLFNYPLVKKMVFHCDEDNRYPFFKYITLVIFNGAVSLVMINFFVAKYSFAPAMVKVLVESILFLANFAIERDFIFTRKVAYED